MHKIKTFFFKTCPKSGQIRRLRTDSMYHKLIFPIVGLVALVWVIVRVIPKPSRAEYPCQQAAIPVAFSFMAWISASTLGVFLVRISRNYFNRKRIIFAGALCIIGLSIFGVAQLLNSSDLSATNQSATYLSPFSTKPNQPIGTAKGIYPGRVTWVRDIAATPWDGKTGKWWGDGNINEQALATMISKSVRSLTGATSDSKAWTGLFQYYNRAHGKGNRAWKPGELIAIKININNTYQPNDVDNDIDQSPQATRALLKQLTGPAGVAQKDIIVYDASVGWKVRAIPDRIYKPLHEEFPEVRWMDGQGSPGREKPEWVANAITYTSSDVELGNELPKAVVEAAYLINIALLKGHEIAGVTLCAKNHFGSIRYPQKDHGKYVSQMNGAKGDYSAFVDLMGSPNLGGKTLLYIVDGLYGMQTNVGNPQERDRWKRLFNGEWSASYFMSQDPVAIESVCLDFLYAEFLGELGYSGAKAFPKGSSRNSDNYLIEAAKGTNAKLGPYMPNGVKIGSLGAHEHWNNVNDKKYSRNLHTGKGIELIKVDK
jgi:hypothetical protein